MPQSREQVAGSREQVVGRQMTTVCRLWLRMMIVLCEIRVYNTAILEV